MNRGKGKGDLHQRGEGSAGRQYSGHPKNERSLLLGEIMSFHDTSGFNLNLMSRHDYLILNKSEVFIISSISGVVGGGK